MHITTVHTLAFTIRCSGNEQQTAALAIIKGGASNMGLLVDIGGLTLSEGEDTLVRKSSIKASTEDRDQCEHYWGEVMRALALIGVEATSP